MIKHFEIFEIELRAELKQAPLHGGVLRALFRALVIPRVVR
jgi:hypothetical protein